MPQVHAQSRAKRRYGVELSLGDLERMAGMIERGEATFVEIAHGNRNIYRVWCEAAQAEVPVVFDPESGHICTVLPSDFTRYSDKRKPSKVKRKREIDPEDLRLRPMDYDPCAECPHEAAPNNLLASRLEEALRKAGMITTSSPTRS